MDALHACLVLIATTVPAANFRTDNFVVTAPTEEFAQQVGVAAEHYRRELSLVWLGREMPRWDRPCPIFVKVGEYGAGGATSFNFDRGEVYGWKMNVQGTAERILDSVLPHEVNHTIFACYFRRPLPRWADEGAASLIEHDSERMRLRKIHEQVMQTTRKIPLQQLLPMREYPSETQQVLTLYAEGYSLADFLIQQRDKQVYLQFLGMALKSGWAPALKRYYGYESIEVLERDLDQWIIAGSPDLDSQAGQMLALSNRPVATPAPTIRAQSESLPSIDLGLAATFPPSSEPQLTNGSAGDRGRNRNELRWPEVTTPISDGHRMSRTRLSIPVHTVSSQP